jgi:protoporphyrinogen/coproporphyrinogen III oxidase
MTDSTAAARRLRVAIIGGGISGLSAAWYLQAEAAAHDLELEYTLLESSPRWGGKILTERVEAPGGESFLIEAGPDSFLTQKPWALQLARELGLDERLLGTNDHQRTVFVLNKGRPVPLPEGLLLIVPTKFLPFALSPLISPLGKLRMGLDLLIPAKRDDADETLADFIRRRLGNEALDKIAEPLLAGIYNAEAEQQSLLATFPRFRDLEKRHGSLIRAMLAARRQRSAATGSGLSIFMSFREGVGELIDALVPRLEGDLRPGATVEQITARPGGAYTLRLDDGAQVEADAVVLTTPAYTSAELLREIAPGIAAGLDAIRYVSTGTLSLAFRAEDVPRPLNGFGLVIPGSEKRPINALTVASTKFDQRAPAGTVLLRAFFGGSRSPQSMGLDDEELLATVRAELRAILGIEAAPLFHRIYRWWRANPQYDLGHLERIADLEAALPPGVYLTGSAYRGVGLPDCVHQSQQIAARLIREHKERAATS